MIEAMKRDRVKGFLDVKGKKIVNEDGQEVILTGWGLGNWLLNEGYMWCSRGSERFDRPRRIEAVIEELTGKTYADRFFQKFRENYITEEDIRYMAELGYNSVRIPIMSRLFMEEGEHIVFLEEGFRYLDRCLDWCEKYRLYAFIDLHGAPGGQTGANIDDCVDDMPRLFIDQYQFDKGIALWKEIAARYCDRWIVGGYDLLNEPIRPMRAEKDIDVDYLVPRLKEFYEKSIRAIREIDKKHLFSIEGHHWASETAVFCKKYDPKMVIHFHRYACLPDKTCLMQFQEIADQWNCPLWLGETGENIPEWFTALYPLAANMGIGYNIWPWKKMDTHNSPCSVKKPKDWDCIIDYTFGAAHPGYEKARRILDEYLENMKLQNCELLPEVSASVLRQPGCTIRGVDFDEFPGIGNSFSGSRKEENPYDFRRGTYMRIVDKEPMREKQFGFDCNWQRFVLELVQGEHAGYSLYDIHQGDTIQLEYEGMEEGICSIFQDGVKLADLSVKEGSQLSQEIMLREAEDSVIRLQMNSGKAEIAALKTRCYTNHNVFMTAK